MTFQRAFHRKFPIKFIGMPVILNCPLLSLHSVTISVCAGAIIAVQNWCANDKNGVTLFVPPTSVYSNNYDVVTGDQSKIKLVSPLLFGVQ